MPEATSAKKAVSLAIRNRWRRQQLAPEIADEVTVLRDGGKLTVRAQLGAR